MNPHDFDFDQAVGAPLADFAHSCHAASVAVVRSGVLAPCRVARGSCSGVAGQHSWVVLGDDCFDPEATIVDPTLWSYDDSVVGVWVGPASERPHRPFGLGSIFKYGQPSHQGGPTIELASTIDWSDAARRFLAVLGPLDRGGWAQLAHAPVAPGYWPAKEILTAMYQDKRLSELIPLDIVGMATDLNPMGLYLA